MKEVRPLPVWLLLFGLLAVTGGQCRDPLAAQPDEGHFCSKLKPGQQKGCFEKEFRAADNRLNKTYQAIKARLSSDLVKSMQTQSRNWIHYKEYQCGWRSEMEAHQDKDTAVYYECLLGMTQERTAYLQRAFGTRHQPAGLAGEYDDGFGGSLTIKALADNNGDAVHEATKETGPRLIPAFVAGQRFDFSIAVVRGPTAHLGDLSGQLVIRNGAGFYEEEGECKTDADVECCQLEFRRQGYSIQVLETNCQAWHGARAFFDGDFYRVH
ncbi:MAG: DUF1311 domain-containing protein [Leptospiraceae bacterium]|nr:DUF1311 domain-containing protein [Leptospiraceae bacterium]